MPTWWTLPISPDGTRVVVTDDHRSAVIYAVAGGAPTPVPHLNPGDVVVQWSPDGHELLVAHRDGLPWVVEQLDLSSGRRRPAVTIRPGAMIYIPRGVFHSTLNTGWEPLRFAVVYAPAGTEKVLRELPDVRVVPAGVIP